MLYFDNFCTQMRPHQNCRPRCNKQRCNILQLSVEAMLYLPSACINHTFCWQLNKFQIALVCLANAADLAAKAVKFLPWGTTGQPSWTCLWTPMQRTCNTRATHVQHDVQHDVQHEHFLAGARMAVFWRLRQALLSHNIDIGGPGVSTSPPQISSWLAVSFEEPGEKYFVQAW